jgi:hypothetical protein
VHFAHVRLHPVSITPGFHIMLPQFIKSSQKRQQSFKRTFSIGPIAWSQYESGPPLKLAEYASVTNVFLFLQDAQAATNLLDALADNVPHSNARFLKTRIGKVWDLLEARSES